MKDTLGGMPYDTQKVSGKLLVRFYRQGKDLKNPDAPKFSITLDASDLKKLSKLCQ